MRLEPSEEYMYRRMDQKDRILRLLPVSGIIWSVGLFLLAEESMKIIGIGFLVAAFFIGVGLVYAYWRIKRFIMPVSNCYLETQDNYFEVVQPYRDDQYENARIYYGEIESMIHTKSQKGIYIRVHGGKSVISGERSIFFIHSQGYMRQTFMDLIRNIEKKLQGDSSVYKAL